MSNFEKLSGQMLQQLKPAELPEHSAVQEKFISLYNSIHGSKVGEFIYHKETFNFKKLISENKVLQECTPLSLYGVFLDVAVNGLSLEQGTKPLAYIIPRNANVGTREKPVWEKRAYLVVSPYGELVMRIRAGHIKHADNPIIVYDGDVFSVYINGEGKKAVKYEAQIPRASNTIIAAFIRLTRPDGSVDFEYLTEMDIQRFKMYSAKNNKGTANELYSSCFGSIDPGFLAGKMIKHAFRTYPKINTRGALTVTETELDNSETINYGVDIQRATEFKEETTETAEAVEVVDENQQQPESQQPEKTQANEETF